MKKVVWTIGEDTQKPLWWEEETHLLKRCYVGLNFDGCSTIIWASLVDIASLMIMGITSDANSLNSFKEFKFTTILNNVGVDYIIHNVFWKPTLGSIELPTPSSIFPILKNSKKLTISIIMLKQMLSFISVSQLIIHYSLKMNQSFHNLKKNLKKQFVKMKKKKNWKWRLHM